MRMNDRYEYMFMQLITRKYAETAFFNLHVINSLLKILCYIQGRPNFRRRYFNDPGLARIQRRLVNLSKRGGSADNQIKLQLY